MSTMLKVLITLAVLLPVGGFVAGTLAANDTAGSPRETIVISESADRGAAPETTTVIGTEVRPGVRFTPRPTPTPTPTPDPSPDPPPAPVDDPPVPVVPAPVDVDDDDDDDGDDGDDDGGDDDDD